MSELDTMALLAEGNPVRIDDVPEMAFPASILAAPRSRTRLVLAVGVAALASGAAAASFAVFGSTGTRSHPLPIPSVSAPGAPPGSITLAGASRRLGAPVVLPDTALVQPADAAATVRVVGVVGTPVEVSVSFPAQKLTISYIRPAPDDALAVYRAGVSQSNSGARIVDLGGPPALFVEQQDTTPGWIEFVTGGTEVVVQGEYDEGTLATVAQSIVDRSRASSSSPPIAAGPAEGATPVADAAAANALLPFNVVLPADATPTSLGVLEQSHQLDAYFDTPTSGPYNLVEGPSSVTVAMLRETATRWTVGPIHEIDVIDGVDVLLQGWSDGSLAASWIRPAGPSRILTWIEGPETAERGQVGGTFTKQQALAVARDIIGRGG
jgi:hypothetical protein